VGWRWGFARFWIALRASIPLLQLDNEGAAVDEGV